MNLITHTPTHQQSLGLPQRRPPEQPSLFVGQPAVASQPKFAGIGPDAFSQFISDTLGVWAPKMPFVRSKTQFFEDTFLEFVEDAAFYFTVPLAGQYLLAPVFHKILGLGKDKITQEAIGTSIRNVAEKGLANPASTKLLAAKSGTLVGALALAAGFEYMIQHVKNVITARHFKTKNFSAVAGLEAASNEAQQGNVDPVEKAKRRGRQVGYAVAGLLAAAVALPFGILRSPKLAQTAGNVLKHIDFSGKSAFDLTKPILAVLIGTGVVSYLDAARDSLERKETATRLAFVVPYLLCGKELAGNLLAKFLENKKVGTGAERFTIKDRVRFINPKLFQDASFLDFSMVKSTVFEEVQKLPIADNIKEAILKKHHNIKVGSYLLSAIAVGAGLCMLTNYQTRKRFQRQQEQQAQGKQQTPPARVFQGNHSAHAQAPAFHLAGVPTSEFHTNTARIQRAPLFEQFARTN